MAGEQLYRNITVDLNREGHPLVGLSAKNRKWEKGDILPGESNLKSLLMRKCRNLTVLQHKAHECVKFSTVNLESLRSIRYVTPLELRSDVVDRSPPDVCGGMALLSSTYSESICCLIPRLPPASLAICASKEPLDQITIVRHYPPHIDRNRSSTMELAPCDTTMVLSAGAILAASAIWGKYCFFPVDQITFILMRSPTTTFGQQFLTTNNADRPYWYTKFCRMVGTIYISSCFPKSPRVRLCDVEVFKPIFNQNHLLKQLLSDVSSGNLNQSILDSIWSTAGTLFVEDMGMDILPPTVPLENVLLKDYIRDGEWRGVLTKEQVEPWLDHLERLALETGNSLVSNTPDTD